MSKVPFVDLHTHSLQSEKETVVVRNLFPGESFAVFSGRNFYSVGLHPWYIKSKAENNRQLESVEEALQFNHVIFVGECGLDKKAQTNFDEQKRVFEIQAVLSKEFGYPLIIHCVKAFDELLAIKKKINPTQPWILHGYNRNKELALQLLNKNFMFSFGKSLLKNEQLAETLKQIPPDKLFFESDEMAAGVNVVYQKAAEILSVSIEELKQRVWNNFNLIETSLAT